MNQTLESRVDQSLIKPQEIDPQSATSETKPLNGAGVALMGTIRTILEGYSPTKPNPNPRSATSATKELIQSPERPQRINEPKESLNKTQMNTSSPEKDTSGDYFKVIDFLLAGCSS